MQTIHLLAVDAEPERFADLLEVAGHSGWRVGWLDLVTKPEVPAALEAATEAGVLRSVAVTQQGTLAAKRLTGGHRLHDLLREHFLGCRLVLVRGEVAAPRLTPLEDGFRIERPEGELRLSAKDLAGRLGRPGPTFLR